MIHTQGWSTSSLRLKFLASARKDEIESVIVFGPIEANKDYF